jgi:hypothetical protein
MPFTFKLSKRLALLKASLAASAAPALACDRTAPTAPQALAGALTAAVTSFPRCLRHNIGVGSPVDQYMGFDDLMVATSKP